MEIKGNLKVLRTIDALRRVNKGLIERVSISASVTILKHSHYWQRISTNDLGIQIITLPDATTIVEGWEIVIQNFGTVDNIDIKDSAASLLKQVEIGKAYKFTLLDNATAAGIWHINFLEDSDIIASARHVQIFNATTDWGAVVNEQRSQTILQSIHTRGSNPIVQVWEGSAAPFKLVELEEAELAANGDFTLRVS